MINDSADIPGISKKFTGEYPKVLAGDQWYRGKKQYKGTKYPFEIYVV